MGSRLVSPCSQPREAPAPCACAWACFRANAVHSLCPSAATEMRRGALLPRMRGRCRALRGGGGWCRGSGVPPPSVGCAACHLPRKRGRRRGAVFIFDSSSIQSRTGFRHPGISVRSLTEPRRGWRRGAPPGTEKATEWSVTARRAGQGLRRDTLMGAHGPGSSLPAPHERVFHAFHTGSPSGDVSRAAGRGGFPTCFRRLTLA